MMSTENEDKDILEQAEEYLEKEISGVELVEVEVMDDEIPDKEPQRIHLKTLEHVRFEMARTYRQMRRNRLAPEVGTKFIFALTQIAKCITEADVQNRVIELENLIKRYESQKQLTKRN
jgi:hypothetical protein